MTWDDLLSSIGGALGLWLGFSIISIGAFCVTIVGKIAAHKKLKYSTYSDNYIQIFRYMKFPFQYTRCTMYKPANVGGSNCGYIFDVQSWQD